MQPNELMQQAIDKKILHLTLHKKWFEMIASGEKKEEYRIGTEYWAVRLYECGVFKKFDEIWFRNGYNPKNPFMRVEHIGTQWDSVCKRYIIHLGEILEVRR